ncbi:MAG: hypothetical protein NT166_18885 [Candidatus Aminicenantes bacterium]|nr:hypothetical protein [Candidatus Aminicenantes bacterium]
MNVAVSSILLFLVFSPGIVFRRGYYSGKFSRKYIKIDLIDEITWAIIPGLIINIGCIYLFQWITGYKINISSLGFLLTGFNNNSESSLIFKKIETNLIPIALFFILSWVLSFLLGKTCLLLVRFFKLDHRFISLRFPNHWFYFFSGEYLEINEYCRLKDIELLLYEVWVDVGGKIEKFKGFVDDFILSRDGGLETIYLVETPEEDKDNEIEVNLNVEAIEAQEPSDYLMIPSKSILKISMWPELKKDHLIDDKVKI